MEAGARGESQKHSDLKKRKDLVLSLGLKIFLSEELFKEFTINFLV